MSDADDISNVSANLTFDEVCALRRTLLKGAGAARWSYSPWPRGAASHVLIVQVSPPGTTKSSAI